MKKRKKRKHDEHMDESWLIPYADILTLLLALFIVMFASSNVDQVKFNQMSQVFNEIFAGGENVLDYASLVETDDTEDDIDNAEGADPEELTEEMTEEMTEEEQQMQELLAEQSERETAAAADLEELQEIQEQINEYIAANSLGELFETELTDEGLLLTIRDNVLFASGSADVRAEYQNIAEDVAGLLEFDPPRNVIITGHTDNVPISTAAFSSNWELSVMRAVNFMKLVIENPNLDPRWFSAKGFGEFQPIASNETEEGRAQNRRVEVLILPRVTSNGTMTNSP
ncbi:flagellar motor protein MotB [Jeotgalibacillus haloalkalitolerans]|uniref:Flagellar motor protein MotB n=1 Tax=Jeotgalibacillus haloalkalitolerans TaxID=3104292 RepID=A0ABU5KRQ4_9BACL|nr:flagellar motor protein MotB [Jeotgalibacillus sp. HH7-29]MDZ5713400.1 flagellar motor protein MotB [Jeotgalibacillus sp. HH7-29]